MRLAGGERDRQRLARTQQMTLSDDLVDRLRAQPLGERYRSDVRGGEQVVQGHGLAFAWSDYAR